MIQRGRGISKALGYELATNSRTFYKLDSDRKLKKINPRRGKIQEVEEGNQVQAPSKAEGGKDLQLDLVPQFSQPPNQSLTVWTAYPFTPHQLDPYNSKAIAPSDPPVITLMPSEETSTYTR